MMLHSSEVLQVGVCGMLLGKYVKLHCAYMYQHQVTVQVCGRTCDILEIPRHACDHLFIAILIIIHLSVRRHTGSRLYSI